MAALNSMVPASYNYSSYRHQLEQQQGSSCRSAQEQYISAATGSMKKQPIRPIARRPCHIDNSNTYFNVATPYGTLLHREQQRLPYPNIQGQIVPAVTGGTSNTANSAGYSSGINSGLSAFPLFHVPAARPSQPPLLPTGPVPLAWPERRENFVAPSRVSNSPPLTYAPHNVCVWLCGVIVPPNAFSIQEKGSCSNVFYCFCYWNVYPIALTLWLVKPQISFDAE
jgi:hypothetical protein